MTNSSRPNEYYEADLFGRPGPHPVPLVSPGDAGSAAPDTNGSAPADSPAAADHISVTLLSEAAADHLRAIAAALFSHRTAVQTATHHEFVARMKPRCSGGQTWRDERYLYAQHSPGDDCPAHGRHDNINQRLRVYVGADVAAQTAALEAMANWRAWQKTVDQLAAARRRLADLETALSDFCRYRCPPAREQPMK
jgi:hypothetical protein